jgi:hypothetical protein
MRGGAGGGGAGGAAVVGTGAGSAGGPGNRAGSGGIGAPSSITGTNTLFGGGGGGGALNSPGPPWNTTKGAGGVGAASSDATGGGGAGAQDSTAAVAGSSNTGGGGGGNSGTATNASAGGSGVVIVKQKNKANGVFNMNSQYNSVKSGQWPTVDYTENANITNSLIFNDNDTAYLNRTRSGQSNKTGTFSVWTKMGNVGSDNILFGGHTDTNNRSYVYFSDPDGYVGIFSRTGGSADIAYNSNARFRDSTSWYHVVVSIDTTQATAAERFKMYINGEQYTDWGTATAPSQDASLPILNQAAQTVGGGYGSSAISAMAEGYMADFHYIDGLALDCTHFGQPDSDNPNIWKPKQYFGNHGTNGFHLEFKQTGTSQNSSGLGADTSGNDNHLAVNNLAAIDQTTDTPTNNFATLNPLQGPGVNYQNGNLDFSNYYGTSSTIAVASGKWYLEMKITNANDYNPMIGIAQTYTTIATQDINNYPGQLTDTYGINREGNLYANASNIGDQGFTLANNDIVGVALDLDSGTKNIKWYKNGSQIATRDLSETRSEPYVFVTYASSSQAGTGSMNFGNPTFSISSGNADANGHGNFEYAPPSGYFALCSKNLAQYG